jgi:NAD(P)-dependent dehydrogenase (short-subunit alcohol dehydrogenase family)
VRADVTSEAEARAAVDRAAALGPLRVVVNCAGVGWGARIVDRSGQPHDLALFRSGRPRTPPPRRASSA